MVICISKIYTYETRFSWQNLLVSQFYWELIFESQLFQFKQLIFLEVLSIKSNMSFTLREKCPYSEFFWSAFSRIWTEYGEIRSITSYSVQMRENTDPENSEYEHFSWSFSKRIITVLFINFGTFVPINENIVNQNIFVNKILPVSFINIWLEEILWTLNILFELSASAATLEFCNSVQIMIDVYIPHWTG